MEEASVFFIRSVRETFVQVFYHSIFSVQPLYRFYWLKNFRYRPCTNLFCSNICCTTLVLILFSQIFLVQRSTGFLYRKNFLYRTGSSFYCSLSIYTLHLEASSLSIKHFKWLKGCSKFRRRQSVTKEGNPNCQSIIIQISNPSKQVWSCFY